MDLFDQEPLHLISDTYSPAKSALEAEKERFECSPKSPKLSIPDSLKFSLIQLEIVDLVISLCGEIKLNNS